MLNKGIKYKIKKDRHHKTRGGTAQFLELSCGKCGNYVVLYQKDGPGNLLRLYIDRIIESYLGTELQNFVNKSDLPIFKCPECDNVMGVPMVYERENRLAFRLIRGSVTKTKQKD
ncbi:MAG: hypothetical protein KJ882_07445 [Proteobacteria bacterium]|nr:hypothetical protein [Pseudomonadota bacterium]